MSSLFERFLSFPEATDALSDHAVVKAMLHFEAALARAQASAGLIPQAAAQSIVGTCKVELFDVPKLVRESTHQRNLATPLVDNLRETVALFNPDAAQFVHVGCHDQDLVDTALTLVTRDVLKRIQTDLAQTIGALLALAVKHAGDAMLDRSQIQTLTATSLGLKCVQWAAPLVRSQQRLQSCAANALSLQLAGSEGPCSGMLNKGAQVRALMATDLQLKAPMCPSHMHHDEKVALACELGLLTGNLGTVSANIAHMAQFEIGELVQPSNPTASVPGAKPVLAVPMSTLFMVARVATQRVPQQVAVLLATLSQEHDNTRGNWQTQLSQWPDLLSASQGMTHAVAQMVSDLHVNTQRMRANLDAVQSHLADRRDAATLQPEWFQQVSELTRSQVSTLLALQATASA